MRRLLAFLFSLLAALALTASPTALRFKYAPRDAALAQELSVKLRQRINDFNRSMGVYPSDTLHLVLTADETDYHRWTEGNKGVIEFADAFYDPVQDVIVIRSPRARHNYDQLGQILFHEYLHFRIDRLWPDAPLWFHEGTAVYFSEGISLDRGADFAWRYLLGARMTLEQMRGDYPHSPAQWGLFYTQSAMAVRQLWNHDRNGFYRLWELGGRGRGFDWCFLRGFGTTARDYSDDFTRILKREIILQTMVASSSLIWGVLPLVLLAGWLKRKLWSDPKIIRTWDAEGITEQETPPPPQNEEEPAQDRPEDDEPFRPYLKGRPKFFQ
jgi:hypothetical protein